MSSGGSARQLHMRSVLTDLLSRSDALAQILTQAEGQQAAGQLQGADTCPTCRTSCCTASPQCCTDQLALAA